MWTIPVAVLIGLVAVVVALRSRGRTASGAASRPIAAATPDEVLGLPAPADRGSPSMHAATDTATRATPAVIRAAPPTSYQQALELQDERTLEAHWSSGTPDPRWSQDLFEYATAEFNRIGIAGEVSDADCRSTLCRVTMRFPSVQDTQALLNLTFTPKMQEYRSFFASMDESNAIATYYVAPKGVHISSILEKVIR